MDGWQASRKTTTTSFTICNWVGKYQKTKKKDEYVFLDEEAGEPTNQDEEEGDHLNNP
jgi:hypothetical protein